MVWLRRLGGWLKWFGVDEVVSLVVVAGVIRVVELVRVFGWWGGW